MRILILGFGNIEFMPYLNFYLQNIDSTSNEISVIFWNRTNSKYDIRYDGVKYYEFRDRLSVDDTKFKKMVSFVRYRRFAQSIIDANDFDYVIAMHTFPALLLKSTLQKEFENRYIFDFRDITYEAKLNIFKEKINDLIKCSDFTFVSSDGFRKYLHDEGKIRTIHNISLEDFDDYRQNSFELQNGLPIRLGYFGYLRNEYINKKLIDRIGSDCRFELTYYGKVNNLVLKLKEYVKERGYANIHFYGEYLPEQRFEILNNIDIVDNVYQEDTMAVAVSNKFYDALLACKPQIAMPDTFMGELVTESNIGLALNPENKSFTDDLYRYYTKIDPATFQYNRNYALEVIMHTMYEDKLIIDRLFNRNHFEEQANFF